MPDEQDANTVEQKSQSYISQEETMRTTYTADLGSSTPASPKSSEKRTAGEKRAKSGKD
jgi:hypothetical protein